MRCSNENCKENPDNSLSVIVVTCDGDLVCDARCKREYEKQKAIFFSEVVHDDKKFNQWMNI